MKKQEVHPEKGDNKAGGGGSRGGGGKKRMSPYGWEKGDVRRDFAELRPEVDLPRKPGTGGESGRAAPPEEPRPHTVFDELRRRNHRVLEALRKLEDTAVTEADRRTELAELAESEIHHKREVEHDLFLLVADEPAASEEVRFCQELGEEIDEHVRRLGEVPPDDKAFARVVRALHGVAEQQIDREQDTVLPVAERVIPLDQAVALVGG